MKTLFALILSLFIIFVQAKGNPQYEMIKVWNFLKYYHPDLASGKIDADSLFLEHVEAKNLDINSSILLLTKHLNNAFEATKPQPKGEDVLLNNQDFSWFQNNNTLTRKNKNLLNYIYKNRYVSESHFYVPKDGYVSEIPNEKKYEVEKNENPSTKIRLLTLAKIIGAIDYLYPHKYLMPSGSTELLSNLVEQAVHCSSRKDFEVILSKAVAILEDTHAFKFYNQLNYKKEIYHTSFFAPFDFQVKDDYILVTDLIIPKVCNQANIEVGDKITSINGKAVATIIEEKSRLLSISNRAGLLHRLSDYQNNLIWIDAIQLKNLIVQKRNHSKSIQTQIELINPSDKANLDLILSYLKTKIQTQKLKKIDHPEIAYFRIDQTFSLIENVPDDKIDQEMKNIFDAASNKKALVFDMRGYPDWGGFVYTYVYGYFGNKENYFGKYYQQNLQNMGTFEYLHNSETYFPSLTKNSPIPYKGQVYIIVNEETLSQSEWNAMNLQHLFPQAITIGQQTAGADGDIKKMQLPGGYVLEFTGNGIFYPNGDETQKKGIKINKMIQYSDDDLLQKKDKIFEEIQTNFE